MIPAAGRDVQCSNCSSTWFQPGVRAEPDAPAPVAEGAEPAHEAQAASPRLTEVDVEAPDGPDGDTDADDVPPRPPRRQIDPGVADILREEAEREARLRRAEAVADPVEVQDEMSLDDPTDTPRNRRIAELEAAEDAFDTESIEAAVASAAAASRRELLPDIEEINSTLRATGDRSEGEEDATDVDTIGAGARRRAQSRRGFLMVILAAIVALLLYLYAGEIAAAVPALAGSLESYVDLVNSGRFWLDDMARSLAGDS